MLQPQVSFEWVEQCLGAGPRSIEGISWTKVGTGQVAASYRGRLQWAVTNHCAVDSVVVKCPSEDPTSRATSLEFGLYEKELLWYQELRERSRVHCPTYFGSWFDADTGDFQLLLQDCAPACQGDQLQGAIFV